MSHYFAYEGTVVKSYFCNKLSLFAKLEKINSKQKPCQNFSFIVLVKDYCGFLDDNLSKKLMKSWVDNLS